MSFVVEDPKSKLNGCARRKSAQRKTQVGAYKKKLEMAGKKPSNYYFFLSRILQGSVRFIIKSNNRSLF